MIANFMPLLNPNCIVLSGLVVYFSVIDHILTIKLLKRNGCMGLVGFLAVLGSAKF